MSDSDGEVAPRIFIDRCSKVVVAVIALVAEDEFSRAQSLFPEWCGYSSYQEWRVSREGFQIGLAMAGVHVKTPMVVLAPFLGWCDETKTRPDERALEAFAAQSYDLWPVLAYSRSVTGENRH